MVAIEPAISGEQSIGLSQRVRSDQEVWNDTLSLTASRAVSAPCARGNQRRIALDGRESDIQRRHRVEKHRVANENRRSLCPNDIARDDRTFRQALSNQIG